jgi:RHS repeat-associated protein
MQYAYTYGILSSITDISDSPNVTLWQADTTNAAGQITEETLGNGIVTNRTYDAVTYWLSSVQSGVGSGSGVQNQAFLFDEMGDVTQRQDNNLGLTENIYYDNDYRLTSSKLGGTTNLSITYAANGNITSRSDVASGATWTYDTTHLHAVDEAGSSSYQYSYDANGNAITRQGNSISWSSYNYPTSISAGSGSTAESVTLAYGPSRQRWSQYYTGNSTTEQTYYVGGLMEVVGTGGVTSYRHYLYAGNEPIGVYTRTSTASNTFAYVLSDHEGSVASITNNSGGVVVPESFTPFGARRNPTTWSGADSTSDLTTSASVTRQAYTFQTELGLWMGMNHMNGRVQDDITGRFLSADPNIQYPGNGQSYNRYSYALNNPLTYFDPSGFDNCAPFISDSVDDAVSELSGYAVYPDSGCPSGGSPDGGNETPPTGSPTPTPSPPPASSPPPDPCTVSDCLPERIIPGCQFCNNGPFVVPMGPLGGANTPFAGPLIGGGPGTAAPALTVPALTFNLGPQTTQPEPKDENGCTFAQSVAARQAAAAAQAALQTPQGATAAVQAALGPAPAVSNMLNGGLIGGEAVGTYGAIRGFQFGLRVGTIEGGEMGGGIFGAMAVSDGAFSGAVAGFTVGSAYGGLAGGLLGLALTPILNSSQQPNIFEQLAQSECHAPY